MTFYYLGTKPTKGNMQLLFKNTIAAGTKEIKNEEKHNSVVNPSIPPSCHH
jgi:hypothetical protein